ncbi:MAG: acyltransferase [Sphingomonas sp.]|uniref:acyltransferase family protein n=1 Tax=Sphingomonas sp. TaxID=28214 RepID=UPI001B29BADB|nr:acyltransferase [Sphingomonas sp.]MBO9622162.1 acyltransferase [Sphingomonas sp.]
MSDSVRQLAGLRGLAALAVVLHHATVTVSHGARGLPGQIFVDLFFVLSGYVMCLAYMRAADRPIRWHAFAAARFARLYPLHLFTAATAALVTVLLPPSGEAAPVWLDAPQLVKELTLTMAFPWHGQAGAVNAPAWSISVEWWTYFLVFPVLSVVLPRVRRWLLPLLFLGGPALLVAIALSSKGLWIVGGIAFARAATGFAAGVAVCLFARGTKRRPSALFTDLLCAAVFGLIYLWSIAVGNDAWFLAPAFPLLIWALAEGEPASLWQRALASGPVVFLGAISYSIYLDHPIIVMLLAHADPFGVVRSDVPMCLTTVVLTLPVAALTWRWIECPAQRTLRGAATRSTPAPAAPPPRGEAAAVAGR